MLRLKGCVVVADALNCQKDTAAAIIAQKADYLLSVKENHPNLKRDIEDFVQDKQLRATMSTVTAAEKNRTRFESKVGTSDEWHYYISSKHLTPEALLKHARAEWSVESMHWHLDVYFAEDDCRIQNENTQKALNIMLDCPIDPSFILDICSAQN